MAAVCAGRRLRLLVACLCHVVLLHVRRCSKIHGAHEGVEAIPHGKTAPNSPFSEQFAADRSTATDYAGGGLYGCPQANNCGGICGVSALEPRYCESCMTYMKRLVGMTTQS
jgi:hypothetical protein